MKLFAVSSSASKMTIILVVRILTAIIGVLFVPVYVRIIGNESYGLVAFYGTMSASLTILDVGLSGAITRQVAVLKTGVGSSKELRDLVYSVEVINWIVAILIGILIVLLAHPIAVYWIKSKELPVGTIEQSVMLMGLMFAVQFPASVYDGVMVGTQKQIPNILVNFVFTILKNVGVIIVLTFVSQSVETYFIWQAGLTFLLTLTLRFFARRELSAKTVPATFSAVQLNTVWKFAAGLTGISLITFFLSQIDKIVVSKKLTLDQVGYYSLAFLIASSITQVLSAMQPVIYPRFTALVAQKKEAELVRLYHTCCKWVAITVFPIGMTLILFGKEILFLWTRNEALTISTTPILQIVAGGTICNCLMWVPYFFMLAKGNTKFTIYQNIISSVILVPLLFWWVSSYGAVGASLVWLTVNAGCIVFSLPAFHHFFMKGELIRWYKKDVALPLACTIFLGLTAKWLQQNFLPPVTIFSLMSLLFIVGLIYALVIPDLRFFLIKHSRIKF